MKFISFSRVWYKKLTSRLWLRDSFCKCCGVDVRDFKAPDDVWDQVFRLGGMYNVLCYQCFCDKCQHIGLPATWHIVEKKYCEYCGNLWDVDSMKYASPMNLACPYCYESEIDERLHYAFVAARKPPFNMSESDIMKMKARALLDDDPFGENEV